MKKYQKAQMIAKNLPTGSYAAGCPADSQYNGHGCLIDLGGGKPYCQACERSK